MQEFDEIYVLDLHGNSKKNERTPEHLLAHGEDKNVFDIEQGVAITFMVKLQKTEANTAFELIAPNHTSENAKGKKLAGGKVTLNAKIHHTELWGSQEYKYDWLEEQSLTAAPWQSLQPVLPELLFIPRDESATSEYEKGWKVTDIFPINSSGIVTARDEFVIDFEDDSIKQRIEAFLDSSKSDKEVQDSLALSENYIWRVSEARKELRLVKDWQGKLTNILYRPFDVRRIIYDKSIVFRTRWNVMRHLLEMENVALIAAKQSKGDWGIFLSAQICAHKTCVAYDVNSIFPLWLLADQPLPDKPPAEQRRPNIGPTFVDALAKALSRLVVEPHALPKGVSPEDVLAYVYAVLHAPSYRSRYGQYLKSGFPRVPITAIASASQTQAATDFLSVWNALLPLGRELIELHLLRDVPAKLPATFPHQGSSEVEKLRYEAPKDETPGWVWINATQCFEGVEPETWTFMVGGYQVCEKWLKDRKGRKLTLDDIERYQSIVAALTRTRALMIAIDKVANGKLWPMDE